MSNPLLEPWNTPYGLPPFALIRPEHWAPAFDAVLKEHEDEVRRIASCAEPATFENTILALDRSGERFVKIVLAFQNLTASLATPELQALDREYSPRLAVHAARQLQDRELFLRVQSVFEARSHLKLRPVDVRLVEKLYRELQRAGAAWEDNVKQRSLRMTQRLSELTTDFAQAVLADEDEGAVWFDRETELVGVSPAFLAAAASLAADRGRTGKWAVGVSRSMVETVLTSCQNRSSRKRVHEAFGRRGEQTPGRDTKPLIVEILSLRAQWAALHGCETFAEWTLQERMAGTVSAVQTLFDQLWNPAVHKVQDEQRTLESLAKADGISSLEPWDWLYYAEQVRSRDFALADEELRPYFRLEAMTSALFWVAERLFGVSFRRFDTAPVYHNDVTVYEVVEQASGNVIGLFLTDNFARPGKSSGAWMSVFREQSKGVLPIVINNNNFVKPPAGSPVRLSLDDVSTLFHEFGHALHGLLSRVDAASLSGTNVLQDFVEVPSQLFEHWALTSEVLERFARHETTGEPLPLEVIQRIRAAQTFHRGWETLQVLGPARLDMRLHHMTTQELLGFDVSAFERQTCQEMGLPAVVGLRHRLVHFQHIFASQEYAAGYYSYLWAEVLEADLFEAFVEAGNPFDEELANRLKTFLYSAGDSADPNELFLKIRGRAPRVEALLRQRGLD